MQIMLDTVNPRYLIPVHGETRHLHLHARMAQASGMAASNIFILNNGAAWSTDGEKAWLDKPVGACDIFVDGRLIGEVGAMVMEDRHRLSQDGFIVALIRVNAHNKLAGEPEIISRGFVPVNGSNELLDAACKEIKQQFKRGKTVAHDNVREMLQNFFYRETQSRPVILPSIIRV
jgi:ribonuclease J